MRKGFNIAFLGLSGGSAGAGRASKKSFSITKIDAEIAAFIYFDIKIGENRHQMI